MFDWEEIVDFNGAPPGGHPIEEQPTEPELATDEAFSEIIDKINGLITRAREELEPKHKEAPSDVLDAMAHKAALMHIDRDSANLGKSVLAIMWKIHMNSLHLFDRAEIDSLTGWVINDREQYNDPDYMIALARATETILDFVHAQFVNGTPVVVDGHKVTVNDIIFGNGYVGKLKMFRHFFEALETDEDRREFVVNLVSRSRSKMSAWIAEKKEAALGIPKVVYQDNFKIEEGRGVVTFIIEDVNQYRLLMSKVKAFTRQQY